MDKDLEEALRRPTLPLGPDTGRIIGRGRNATYEIPCIPVGKGKKVVPTSSSRRTQGLVETAA